MTSVAMLAAGVFLAGCTKSGEEETSASPTAAALGNRVAEQASSPVEVDLPSEFLQTAWLATAPDGARYVTYLDEGGRYRDFRNGDLWQEGTWETDPDDRLCFLPEDEGGVLRCWHPDRMQGNNAMIVSSEDGTRIRLERADYAPPADEEADESQ